MQKNYILFILLFTFTTANSFAQDIKVFFSKGDSYKISAKKTKTKIKKGMTLSLSDFIETSSKSFLILKISGHSTIRIEENTKIEIRELPILFDKSNQIESKGNLFLEIGTIIIEMDKTFNNDALEIETENSIMGVRGTTFLISKDQEQVLLSVNKGLVEIHSKDTNENDFVEKDESIFVENSKGFTARQKYNFQNKIHWNVNDKKLKKNFSSIKALVKKEFQSKKKKWKLDHNRRKVLKQKWINRKNIWKDRTKALQGKKIKSSRKNFREREQSKLDKKIPMESTRRKELTRKKKERKRKIIKKNRQKQIDKVRRRIKKQQKSLKKD